MKTFEEWLGEELDKLYEEEMIRRENISCEELNQQREDEQFYV